METEMVDNVRSFNRFYTRRLGLLGPGYLKTEFPLTHARILFEIAHRENPTARDLIAELEMDPGYMSRILSSFEKDGLLKKFTSKSDSRLQHLTLTAKGKKTFAFLNKRSNEEVSNLLKNIGEDQQQQLQHSMRIIENILSPKANPEEPYLIRTHRPGDVGWIISRHGLIYAQEYGFDDTFEGLVAEILGQFLRHHNSKKECIWIAERDRERVGTVTVVDAGNNVSQLRCLLVEPKARGLGIGKRLIQECIEFSRNKGYKKMKLWTQSILSEARHLYEKAGFHIVEKTPEKNFGKDLVAEVWEMTL
jgi:DNA-binding MarR family transcriptional regulator/N-acetylglutamate synthase-like GNAT family acetyltransferase